MTGLQRPNRGDVIRALPDVDQLVDVLNSGNAGDVLTATGGGNVATMQPPAGGAPSPDRGGFVDPTTTDLDLIYRKATTVSAITLGFIGDSITLVTGVVADVVADLSTASVTVSGSNQAVSGTRSPDWVSGSAHLVAAKAAFASAGVRLVHYMIGTNDSQIGTRTTPTAYRANVLSTCLDLIAAGYLVVLAQSPYIVPGSDSGTFDAESDTLLQEYQAQIVTLCDGDHIRLGDVQAYGYFQANQSQLSDGIHPNSTGATNLALLWAAALQSVVNGLSNTTVLQRLTLGANLSISGGVLNAADAATALAVEHGGTLVGTRGTVNLIDGAHATLTVADNAGASRVDVTIDAAGPTAPLVNGDTPGPTPIATADGQFIMVPL